MRSNLGRHRWALSLIFFALAYSPPAAADTFAEALPLAQNQSSEKKSGATSKKKKTTPSVSAWDESEINEEPNDPLEPFNRLIFGVNNVLDVVLLQPAAEIYRAALPDPVRHGVSNFLDNLFAPVVFLNHVLQGQPERAATTFFRFLANSTLGLAGLVDVTSEMGYPRYDTSFNETLAAWGVDTGPYLVLPIIGSSSFRGGVGIVGDYFSDPLNLYLMNRRHWKYHYWLTVRYGFDMLSQREKVIDVIKNLRQNSPDMYITMRSIYFQRQAYMAKKLKSANTPEATKAGA